MRLTNRQKRTLIRLAIPGLALAYWTFRVASLDAFRHHRLPLLRRTKPKEPAKRILVVRLDTIGDVVLSEPALRAIKRAYPEAQLDVLVGAAGKAVLSGNPCIDSFLVYDAPWHASWRGRKVRWRSEVAKGLRTVREVRRSRYDIAMELRGDPRDIAFMALSGAASRVGSGWRGGGFMLDVDVGHVDGHRVDFALTIAASAGAAAPPSPPQVWFGDAERQLAKAHLPKDGRVRYVALHMGAGFPSKCLPVDSFAAVARTLTASSGERRAIVVIGGRDEASLLERFKALFGATPIELVGKLNLLETAAVLERCALFVGNDSGPMHLAAAVGTPVVAFFGPSEPDKYRPYMVDYRLIERPLSCRPCDHIHCSQSENICMTGIDTADIVSAAEELLSRRHKTGNTADD